MSYRRSFEFIPPFLLYLYVIVLFQGHWTKAVAISNNKHESHKVALFSSITTIQSSHYQHIQSENKLATELKLPKPYCVIKTCQDRPAIPPVSETRNSVIQEEPQDPETIAYDEESSVAQLAQRLQYQRNTQGIVTMASASAVPVLIVWLHMLRGSGTRLPVEVFFPSWSRRDEFIWGRSLRPFNVRCRSLNVNPATTLDQAPLVASAMLFSSFENVLFLKLDTFPTTDAGKLFASDQYISNGLLALPVEYLDAAPLRLDVLMLNKTTRAEPVTRLAYHKTFSPQWDCPLQCSSSGSQEPTQHDDTFLPTSLGASFHREEVTLISQPESSGISRIRLHSCGKSGMETVFVQLKSTKTSWSPLHCEHNYNTISTSKMSQDRSRDKKEHARSVFRWDMERQYWRHVIQQLCSGGKQTESVCRGYRACYASVFGVSQGSRGAIRNVS